MSLQQVVENAYKALAAARFPINTAATTTPVALNKTTK